MMGFSAEVFAQTDREADISWRPREPFLDYVGACLASIQSAADVFADRQPVTIAGFAARMLEESHCIDLDAFLRPGQSSLLQQHLDALLKISLPETEAGVLLSARWSGGSAHSTDSGRWKVDAVVDEDFVFRYPLADALKASEISEYVAALLRILCDSVDVFDASGRLILDAVSVGGRTSSVVMDSPFDPPALGFRSDGASGTGSRHPLHSIAATEHAIVTIARHWALLSRFLRLTNDEGEAVVLNGFRLRSAGEWVVPSVGHVSEIYEYLARVCNVACKFCYLYGNPSGLAVARGATVISTDEIETRLRYYDPERGRALFQAQWEINEFLVDPKIHQVLPKLRAITGEPFYFITNGNPLNEKTIDLLERVKPVHLIVSVNTLDEELRGSMMQERKAQTSTALGALRQLVARRIPIGISLAAFPEFSIEDLVRTIRLADSLPAGFVRVNLPGFTRELPYPEPIDTDRHWRTVTEALARVRSEISIPLIIIPSAFEESLHEDPLAPTLIGVVSGSPAARAGLRPNDRITAINGFTIGSRADILSLLLLLEGSIQVEFERGAERKECVIDTRPPWEYPYDGPILCKYVFPHGVVAAPAISPRVTDQIRDHLDDTGASSFFMITSQTMERTGRLLLQRYAPDLYERADFIVARNEFLGGNIRIMDMCTTSDIALAIERCIATTRRRPELILLSDSGFNRQGRDLQGGHWSDLERWFRVPVRLLSVPRFAY